MEGTNFRILLLLGIIGSILCQSVKYSSDCSVPLCTSNTKSNCSGSTPCYSYQTATNKTICAPRIDCSLFDTCAANGKCASNTSVCIVNSCCCQSICMPLSAASGCLTNNNTNITQNSSTTYSSSTTTSTTSTSTASSTTGSVASLLNGVQLNFNPALLPNSWSQCYNGKYNIVMNSTVLSMILNVCNKGKLMLGCRPVGNALLNVAAMGLRNDVLYDCGTLPNCTNVANGVGWYFSYDYSWGFVNGTDSVTRYQCDTDSVNSAYRLCWHTLSYAGGYRCGSNNSLNDDATFERVIYHSN